MMQKAKASSIMVYTNSHTGHCFFPTKTGVMHKNLKGRDFFGEVVSLAHKKDIPVVAYYSLIFNNVAYIDNPEWRTKAYGWLPFGGKTASNRYGTCCPNSDYLYFAFKQIEEIFTSYECEGVFYDMTFWPGVCSCDNCKKRYLKFTQSSLTS